MIELVLATDPTTHMPFMKRSANPNPNPYPNPNPNPNPNPKPNPNTDPNQVGFVSLLREHFVRLPTRSFVLDCSLRMGGPRDSGGEGLSISYGDIPEAALKEGVSVGERGAGRGLRLLLRTYVHNQLVVMWDNVIMHTVAVDLG